MDFHSMLALFLFTFSWPFNSNEHAAVAKFSSLTFHDFNKTEPWNNKLVKKRKNKEKDRLFIRP